MLEKPCPVPVVEAKKVLAESGAKGVVVLVDNITAVQNLEKMANRSGYSFSFEQKHEAEYAATISVGPGGKITPVSFASKSDGVVVLLTGDQIGISEPEAGQTLMKAFLLSLGHVSNAPKSLLLLNRAVMLAASDSDSLELLMTIAERGTDILSCGKCLEYYELTEKLAVGRITNMFEVAEILTSSQRTITI